MVRVLLIGASAAAGMGIFVLLRAGFEAVAARAKTVANVVEGQSISLKKDRYKQARAILEADPYSKKSRKILIYLCGGVFVLSWLAIGRILFAGICAGAVYYGITNYFAAKIKKQTEVFERQLIEALAMITNSVRAGQSLMQAMENMVKDMKPPIATAFGDVLQKVKLGKPMNEALMGMCETNSSKDLRIAVVSINLARESGGNMGEILLRLSSTMSERKKMQGKILALTAQGRASGMVMSSMPFLLLGVLYLMEPGMVGLMFTTTLGNVLLTLVIGMIAFGSYMINRIITIDI